MSGFFNWFRETMLTPEYDDYPDEEEDVHPDDYYDEETPVKSSSRARRDRDRDYQDRNSRDSWDDDRLRLLESERPRDRGDRTRSSSSSRRTGSASNNVVGLYSQPELQCVLMRPKDVSDSIHACDHVKSGRMCVIIVEGMDGKMAQRVADVMGGVAYALEGDIKRISDSIFIVAPKNVRITAEMEEELNSSGFFFQRASGR
jgi:cell division inhibitor SepF